MPRKPSKPKTTRRGKNEGSVYRRKDGKWVGQVTVGYHPDTSKPIRKYTTPTPTLVRKRRTGSP